MATGYKAIINIDVQAKSLEEFYRKLRGDSNRAIRNLKKQEEQLKRTFGQRAQARMKKFGRGLTTLANKTRFMKYAAVAGMGAAIKVTMDYEHQMFRAGYAMQATTKDAAALAKEVRRVASGSMFDPVQIATTAKNLGKLGLSAKKVTRDMAAYVGMAQLSEMTPEESSPIFGAAYAKLGKPEQSAKDFMNVFAATLQTSALKGEDLKELFTYSLGSLQFYEGPTEDIAAMFGTLANSLDQASRAGVGVRATFDRMAKPVGESLDILKRYQDNSDVNFNEIIGDKGYIKDFTKLLKLIKDGAKHSNNMAGDLKTIFGKISGSSIAKLLGAGEDTDFITQKMRAADLRQNINGGDIIGDFSNQFNDTTYKKWMNFVSRLQDLAIEVGKSGLVDAFEGLLEMIVPLIDWFKELNVEQKQWVVGLGIFGTAALAILPAVAALATFLGSTGGIAIFSAIAGGIASLVAAIASLPVLAIAAVVAAIGAIIYNFPTFLGIFYDLGATILNIFTGTWEDVHRSFARMFAGIAEVATLGLFKVMDAWDQWENSNKTIVEMNSQEMRDKRDRSLMYTEGRNAMMDANGNISREAQHSLTVALTSDTSNEQFAYEIENITGGNTSSTGTLDMGGQP